MSLGTTPVLVVPSVGNGTIWLPVSDVAPDGTVIDPRVGTVEVAYTTGSDPVWQGVVGAWESNAIVIDDVSYYLVRIGLGASPGLAIPKGYYVIWLKLNFINPALVIRHSSIYVY